MVTDKKLYNYRTWDRLELPIDLSKKGLASQIGCSCHQIDSALEALDGKSADVLNSCYSKLVRGRKAGIVPDKRNSNLLDTTTFAFYWEIIELVKGLTKAKQKNKRAKADDLAICTFEVLADNLAQKLTESISLSFSQRKMLGNQNILNKMNQGFLSEVYKRLDAVKYIVEHDPTSKQILAVCDKLDALIMEWSYGKDFNYYETRKITVRSVEELYDSLMKVRTDGYVSDISSNLPYDAASRKPPVIRFEAPSNLIENLQEYLPVGTTRIKDEQRLYGLACVYEKFLTSNISAEEKRAVSASIKDYLTLKDYVAPREDQDTTLEDTIRKDLIKFVKEQFSELQNLEYIPFPYSAYKSSSLQTDFLKERIKNVQTKILYEFYEPFRLLRIFYSIRNFTCFDKDSIAAMENIFKASNSFGELITQMEQALFRLGSENPQLPLGLFEHEFPAEAPFSEYIRMLPKDQFSQKYRKTVIPVFGEEPEILKPILDALVTGEYRVNTISEATAVSSLLYWACQIAMLDSIVEWTALLKEDYTQLMNFYREIDEIKPNGTVEKSQKPTNK